MPHKVATYIIRGKECDIFVCKAGYFVECQGRHLANFQGSSVPTFEQVKEEINHQSNIFSIGDKVRSTVQLSSDAGDGPVIPVGAVGEIVDVSLSDEECKPDYFVVRWEGVVYDTHISEIEST